MTMAADKDVADEVFTIEDISTGMYASGFGKVGDGRSFSFRIERQLLMVEIYRPRLAVPVPHAEDVVAVASHSVAHVDVNDERSLVAAVRDAVADAQPVPRTGR
ncbi:MAG: hypothetical protein QOG79_1162 [Mycobacterium sp.]|jgi:hypothetical protein|nr:hypothetical protein [Mycobacterium sp.]MDT5286863.1 hypothetical protein [Mycobacterium sp.]MDT5297920.1 hypothetical protein [Mycobacterium sp.]MDT5362865.1 hypothetical protein [Mycobacterium sp.]